MITSYDSRPEFGLEIARGALSPRLAQNLEAECAAFTDRRPKNKAKAAAERVPIVQEVKSDYFKHIGNSALLFVLQKINMSKDHKVFVGYQPPYSLQSFHPDEGVDAPVVVIHASDGGIFDYIPPETPKANPALRIFTEITVNAGDIVAQFNPRHYHRGGNPTSHERYNIVIGQPVKG